MRITVPWLEFPSPDSGPKLPSFLCHRGWREANKKGTGARRLSNSVFSCLLPSSSPAAHSFPWERTPQVPPITVAWSRTHTVTAGTWISPPQVPFWSCTVLEAGVPSPPGRMGTFSTSLSKVLDSTSQPASHLRRPTKDPQVPKRGGKLKV